MKKLLFGNEAIALGAYESGVRVASGYPGTPSTEIMEKLAQYENVRAEWAPNEKVALDVVAGASYAGVRALATMKHVGLNVAADPLFYCVYTGVKGGLVIVTADDPGLHSSQNEQDNRNYAKFAKLPMLEPSDSQEARDFVHLAFALSERFGTPVLLRTTTRIAHSKSLVEAEWPPQRVDDRIASAQSMKENPSNYVMVPANAKGRHPIVEDRLRQLAEYAETCPANVIEPGDRSLGIISGGVAYTYAREAFPQASFLKLGMSYPMPSQLIRDFAASVDKLIVVEELDPFIEEHVRLLGIEVAGKCFLPMVDEFSVDLVRQSAAAAGLPATPSQFEPFNIDVELPVRPPALCAGCGHRGVFYVLNKMKVTVSGDIGCYTLSVAPPLSGQHFCGCMGASIGVLHGLLKAGATESLVATIGDSTFFHTGMPALLNMTYNNIPGVTIILDNHTTAMTGHQENPGTGKTLLGEVAEMVDLEALVRALGVHHVSKVDPYDLKATQATIEAALAAGQPAVVIAERGCVLKTRAKSQPLSIDPERCNGCGLCQRLGCPALSKVSEKLVRIDEVLCTGCGLCAQVCARKAVLS